jgi:hypothetical protein
LLKTVLELVDLLRIILNKIDNQTPTASVPQEFDRLSDRYYRRASDLLSLMLVFSRPSETIKVCELTMPGAQDGCPRG